MRESFYNVIRGKVLVSEGATETWRFILFVSVLALIMISSSHRADKKVYEISKLHAQVKELKSEYVDVRIRMMSTQMESRLIAEMKKKGFQPSEKPPQRIKIIKQNISQQNDIRVAGF